MEQFIDALRIITGAIDQHNAALRAAYRHGFWAGVVVAVIVFAIATLCWYVTKDADVRREFWRFGKSRHRADSGKG